tara:strand:+ start:191 stop:598 length:408 start_codon:yes stop_codon:yes gene_type:complete
MSIVSLISVIGGILDKIIPDKDAKERAKAELLLLDAKGELELIKGQLEINKQEANHDSVFVAGARPFILWVCGIVFCYHYLVYPIVATIASLNGFDVSVLPKFDLSQLMTVLGGLLGLGGLRTVEKIRGVARSKI